MSLRSSTGPSTQQVFNKCLRSCHNVMPPPWLKPPGRAFPGQPHSAWLGVLERVPKLNSTPSHAGERNRVQWLSQLPTVLAWGRYIVCYLAHARHKTKEGTPQAKEGQVEIANEPLTGGQLPSKDRQLGSHPQKAKESS